MNNTLLELNTLAFLYFDFSSFALSQMDNYSRFILNYQVSTRVSARIRLDSIRNAYREYINEPVNDTILLVYGGVENNNHLAEQYCEQWKIQMRQAKEGRILENTSQSCGIC